MDADAYKLSTEAAAQSRLGNATTAPFNNVKEYIKTFINTYAVETEQGKHDLFFFDQVATTLAQTIVIEPLAKFKNDCNQYYHKAIPEKDNNPFTNLVSYVKDMSGVWFKDTIMSLALDLFGDSDKGRMKNIFSKVSNNAHEIDELFKNAVLSAYPTKPLGLTAAQYNNLKNSQCTKMQEHLHDAISKLFDFFTKLNDVDVNVIASLKTHTDDYDRPTLGGYKKELLGIRQDTFIPSAKVKKSADLASKRLHVVEYRNAKMDQYLNELAVMELIRIATTYVDAEEKTAMLHQAREMVTSIKTTATIAKEATERAVATANDAITNAIARKTTDEQAINTANTTYNDQVHLPWRSRTASIKDLKNNRDNVITLQTNRKDDAEKTVAKQRILKSNNKKKMTREIEQEQWADEKLALINTEDLSVVHL